VLDLSKMEAGKLELEEMEFDLAKVLRGAHSAFTQIANAKGLSFTLAMQDSAGVYLGDPTRLRQILYNLISNAVKFTDRGGVVRIRARRDGARVAIAVIDTGIGIATADLSRLYRTFEQLTLPSGDRPGGTGLGLALTKRLVEMHGGTIDVESELGVGTTFTVRIPVG